MKTLIAALALATAPHIPVRDAGEGNDGGRAGANKMCGSCGVTTDNPSVLGSDYFDVIIRAGRPMGRVARFRCAV